MWLNGVSILQNNSRKCFRLNFTIEMELGGLYNWCIIFAAATSLPDNSCLILHSFVPLQSLITGTCSFITETCSKTRRRQWHPTPVLLPGKSHWWRSLVGCSPWGREESDMTERLHFHFSLLRIGEGNGNPLQSSCLENPRDGVSQSRQKWLSSSSSSKTSIVARLGSQKQLRAQMTSLMPKCYIWFFFSGTPYFICWQYQLRTVIPEALMWNFC